jgi:PiT family inorganic phosphate transporter
MNAWPLVIVGATLFVAYANGANDNFKGVATLFGSGTTDYRKALAWATVTTFAGSVTAFFLATELFSMFQGKGVVPDVLIRSESFLAAVILGAALTLILATKFGMPISTTHGLTGALFGGGFVAVGTQLGFQPW